MWKEGESGMRREGTKVKEGRSKRAREQKRARGNKRGRRGQSGPFRVAGIHGCCQVTVGIELRQNVNSRPSTNFQ